MSLGYVDGIGNNDARQSFANLLELDSSSRQPMPKFALPLWIDPTGIQLFLQDPDSDESELGYSSEESDVSDESGSSVSSVSEDSRQAPKKGQRKSSSRAAVDSDDDDDESSLSSGSSGSESGSESESESGSSDDLSDEYSESESDYSRTKYASNKRRQGRLERI